MATCASPWRPGGTACQCHIAFATIAQRLPRGRDTARHKETEEVTCHWISATCGSAWGPRQLGGPGDLEAAILEFIAQAQNSLDVAVQELKSREVARALVQARATGGTGTGIRGVFDAGQGNQHWAGSKGLAAAGVEVHLAKLGKLHHKLMVLDDRAIIVGSFN